jgi:hypothetical protein
MTQQGIVAAVPQETNINELAPIKQYNNHEQIIMME